MRIAAAIGCAIFVAAFMGPHVAEAANYEAFRKALEKGASCAELFKVRNAMDPKSPDRNRVNEALRSVGCYSIDSKRTK